ncbi:hypothetical protein [Pseudoclavibacter helvolus]|uniref:Uncharacterized protein n=1 Tax=Pseudoclavibacter helvolus TaxID=255205 RepID=A0A7W4YDZ4_9MICO|nr:hypothetical protein [Pseudoclavibacter helvolus]MBB2956989.1 hypothetical protein [Pseudoclavibacter helvolus]
MAEQGYGQATGFKVARALQRPLSAIVVADEHAVTEPDRPRPKLRYEPLPEQVAAEAEHSALMSYVLNGRDEFEYSEMPDSSLLAEDDYGYLCGPSEREGWWVDYDSADHRHVAAAAKSRETGRVVLVERGAGEDG